MNIQFSKSLRRAAFYGLHALVRMVPSAFWRRRRLALVEEFQAQHPNARAAIEKRVDYYNRLSRPFALSPTAERASAFSSKNKSSAYSCDFRRLTAGLPAEARVSYLFGDVTEIPETPHFVKSRPVTEGPANANSVLLKLNSIRHYCFVEDQIPFAAKKPMAVWRGKSNRQHRIDFARRFADHPMCNIGCVRHKEKSAQPWHRNYMSIQEQLQYQFIISVEGIDVATNLKWIMASNSLCLMRKPRYETWFMEGSLIAGYHYVQLKDDHSDLPAKIEYYRNHPDEAQAIIKNANAFSQQFMDRRQETLIAWLVIDRYLQLSGQPSETRRYALAEPA
ncbi:MAG: lipopolysaccharide A protein [Alteromonadaceae bacterium]|nr:lipopolysaccharide A protein [Alteromonadaceae bacterium]